jgi:hypothetical protein
MTALLLENATKTRTEFGGKCLVSKTLMFEGSQTIEGEFFCIKDCKYIRSRQYLELESCNSHLLKICWVRYTVKFNGLSHVVVSYLHKDRFEIAVLLDASKDASNCFLRTLTDREFASIKAELLVCEDDFRNQNFF